MLVNYIGMKNSKLLTNGFFLMLIFDAWKIALSHCYNETLELLIVSI